jgi:CCR4-NOT transcriptional regulation complex NOT5 subunit
LEVTPAFIKRAPEKILFYMFYNMPFERQQHDAAKELESRGWKYDETNMRWSRNEGG